MVFLRKLAIILQNWYTILWIAPKVNSFWVYIDCFFEISAKSFQIFGELIEVFVSKGNVWAAVLVKTVDENFGWVNEIL